VGPSGVKRISGTHEGVTGDFRAIFKFAVPKPAAYVLRLMHRIAPAEMDTTPETLEKRLWEAAVKFSPSSLEADFSTEHVDSFDPIA